MADANLNSQLEKINRLTRKTVTADDVYIFPVVLCDNDIDRDNERFTVPALRELAKMFIGKTGIFDHSMKSSDQTARIFDAEVELDSSRKNSVGETYAYLKAYAYMMRDEKNAALINEIEGGIKKEVSVGCGIASKRCSICGADRVKSPCSHRAGEMYGGKRCHTVLDRPTDAYEWSFVAIPAQPMAGVVKAYSPEDGQSGAVTASDFDLKAFLKGVRQSGVKPQLSSGDMEKLFSGLSELSSSIDEVNGYRELLHCDIVKLSAKAAPFFSEEFISRAVGDMSISELKSLRDTLEQQNSGMSKQAIPQLYVEDNDRPKSDNSQFRI